MISDPLTSSRHRTFLILPPFLKCSSEAHSVISTHSLLYTCKVSCFLVALAAASFLSLTHATVWHLSVKTRRKILKHDQIQNETKIIFFKLNRALLIHNGTGFLLVSINQNIRRTEIIQRNLYFVV